MFERFTDRSRKVMALANQQAQHYHHQYIGTEHILLGLVEEGGGVGANVLDNLDVDPAKVRGEIKKLIKSGPKPAGFGKLPQTPRAKKVIEYAIEEARKLNHHNVGTEHLLLGLLRERDGLGSQVLVNLGLRLDAVREKVLEVLGAGLDAPEKSPVAADPSPEELHGVAHRIGHVLQEIKRRRQVLLTAMNEANSNADYERAAEFRDRADEVQARQGEITRDFEPTIRKLEALRDDITPP